MTTESEPLKFLSDNNTPPQKKLRIFPTYRMSKVHFVSKLF